VNNLEILADAFEFIEVNLQKEIKTQDVADACFCSKSALEKIFRCVSKLSVHEYILKRRMMIAARMIADNSGDNMLDIALKCGYSTHESFTRAFKSVWNCNPSEFKNRKSYPELFPRRYPPMEDGGMKNMRNSIDISEMYDLFKARANCYFVCCDIKHLVPINDIAYKAGDLAILETMERMYREAGEGDYVFRIGADEFVMLTGSEDSTYAESICNRIREYNGQCFKYEDKEIPLNLHIVATKFEGSQLKYNELYEHLHNAINKCK